MIVAQISDPHVCTSDRASGGTAFEAIDAADALRRAVRVVNGLRPDAVLLTGDVVERGEADEYAIARVELDRLDAPCLSLPGNHDGPAFWSTFADQLPGAKPGLGATHDIGDQRMVLLDTSVPGQPGGAITPEREEWLHSALLPGAVLAMHHPPIATGIARMDAIGLEGTDRLLRAIGDTPPRAIVCGHIHRAVYGSFAGVPVVIAPSCAQAIALDLAADAPLAVTDEPAAVMVHRIAGDALASHLVPVSAKGSYRSTCI